MRKLGLRGRLLAALLALVIGVVVVAANALLFTLLTGRPLTYANDVEPHQVTIVAIPFLVLALIGVGHRRPWGVGLALTLALWGFVLFDGVRYQWNPDGTGANIGLGLLVMVSPLFITAITVAIHLRQHRAPDRVG
jgi:hypothetical protein